MFLRMLKTIYTLLKKIAVSNQIKTTCNTFFCGVCMSDP